MRTILLADDEENLRILVNAILDDAPGLVAGVNAHLTRPFSPLQLLDAVAELLEL